MIRTSVIINITTDITIELENLFDELTVFGTMSQTSQSAIITIIWELCTLNLINMMGMVPAKRNTGKL